MIRSAYQWLKCGLAVAFCLVAAGDLAYGQISRTTSKTDTVATGGGRGRGSGASFGGGAGAVMGGRGVVGFRNAAERSGNFLNGGTRGLDRAADRLDRHWDIDYSGVRPGGVIASQADRFDDEATRVYEDELRDQGLVEPPLVEPPVVAPPVVAPPVYDEQDNYPLNQRRTDVPIDDRRAYTFNGRDYAAAARARPAPAAGPINGERGQLLYGPTINDRSRGYDASDRVIEPVDRFNNGRAINNTRAVVNDRRSRSMPRNTYETGRTAADVDPFEPTADRRDSRSVGRGSSADRGSRLESNDRDRRADRRIQPEDRNFTRDDWRPRRQSDESRRNDDEDRGDRRSDRSADSSDRNGDRGSRNSDWDWNRNDDRSVRRDADDRAPRQRSRQDDDDSYEPR